MSKFKNIDDAIKNSFDNFEVDFDASQWDLLNEKLNAQNAPNAFDDTIHSKLKNHEVAYDATAWTAVESQLVQSTSLLKWYVAAGFVAVLTIGGWLLLNKDSKTTNKDTQEEKNELVVKNDLNKEENKVKASEFTIDNSISNSETITHDKTEFSNENTVNTNVSTSESDNNSYSNSQTTNNESNNTTVSNQINTNNNNNNVNQNVVVNVLPPASWSFAAPKISGQDEICQGEKVLLTSATLSNDIKAEWKVNGIYIADGNQPFDLSKLAAGVYNIELVYSATKRVEECDKPIQSTSKQVTVKSKPTIDFKYDQIGDAYYPETKLNALTDNNDLNFAWKIDGKVFNGNEVIYLFNKKGTYPITLTTEYNGCTIEEIKNIEISNDFNLLAPIAFTPNADGINDAFIPEALKVLNLPFKMTVYDRQQGFVYQTSRVDAPWDGRNLNTGEFCTQGSYMWVVELTNKEGKTELYSGTITLLK